MLYSIEIGIVELTAHSIAMNIFMVAVMPVAGMSITVSILVGQQVGAGELEMAERVTFSAIHLATIFFGFAGMSYFHFFTKSCIF